MKNKFIYSAFLALLVSLTSCDDYMDINRDPDRLLTLDDPVFLLPTAQAGIANTIAGWEMGFASSFWVQYWTQSYTNNQFTALVAYEDEEFSLTWRELYRALSALKEISDKTKNATLLDGTTPKSKAEYYIAEALSIYTWQIITDLWGDVPYKEALQGESGNLSPKFDTQESIYADLRDRIDKLIALDINNYLLEKKSFDFIHGGDMEAWEKFAFSLKLKIMMRLSETGTIPDDEVKTFVDEQIANLATSSDTKLPATVFGTNAGKIHPMKEFADADYVPDNIRACKSFSSYLELGDDPRLAKLFDGTNSAFFGDNLSLQDSDGDGTLDNLERYSSAIFDKNEDIMLISSWEINFYLAEVYLNAGDDTEAKKYYENAVKASLSQHGIAETTILENADYAKWDSATTKDKKLELIGLQKWVAYAKYQVHEAMFERNRLKIPSVSEIDVASDRQSAFNNFPTGQLTISVRGFARLAGELPSSAIYPDNIIAINFNSPPQKRNIADKVWWDKKPGK